MWDITKVAQEADMTLEEATRNRKAHEACLADHRKKIDKLEQLNPENDSRNEAA